MPHFIIQPGHRLHHNGVEFTEGSTVELTEEQAAALIPHGIVAASAQADGEEPAAGKRKAK